MSETPISVKVGESNRIGGDWPRYPDVMLARLIALLRWMLAASLLCHATGAVAQLYFFSGVDPRLEWRTLETPHFYIHFAAPYRQQANLVAGVAEGVYPRVTRLLSWEPRSRTHVVVLDSMDFSNGFASPLPFNYAGIWLSPPDEGELLQNRDWLELVLTHEFLHIVHLDKARGGPLGLRNVLGRILPFFPNALQPDWVIEGLAVYAESEQGRGYGRLGQSAFEGMMRAERERGLRSLREVNAQGRGFPLNRDYLYGGYFFAFLRERYGEGAVARFVEDYSGNVVPFRIESNPRGTTGKAMDELWQDYHQWLNGRFGAAPGAQAPSEGDVLARAFSITAPAIARDGTRWYVESDGYTRPRLIREVPGREREAVREVEAGTRLAAAPDGSVLATQEDVCANYNLFYDVYRIDAGDQWSRLTHCSRDRFAAGLDNGRLATIRVTAGEAEVVVLDPATKLEQTVYRGAPGESLTGIAAKGGSIAVTSLKDSRWSVIEITDGKASLLVRDEAVKHSPRFGDSADEIYFVADYDKAYDLWSVRRNGGQLSRWTQASNGVREISAPVGGEVLLTTIEADGAALRGYRLPPEPLERRQGGLSAPTAETAALTGKPPASGEHAYSPWSSLRPRYWLPLLSIGDGTFAVGAITSGQDALGVHQYAIAPLYELTQNELLGSAAYVYDGRHSLLVDRTMIVKSSEQDDQKTLGRRVTSYTIRQQGQWISTWRYLELNRRFFWGLGGAVAQERLYFPYDGVASLHNERVLALVGGVDTRREQWLSEGPSQGQWLRLFAETSNGLGGDYTGNVYRADWRFHLPLGTTVLGGRWNEGYGQQGAQPFQLGGSDSDEYIDLPVLNQRQFALRGYSGGEPTLRGHHARILTGEWRVPLVDVDRHLMVPPVGLNRISLNVFTDVGAAWDRGSADYHRSVGMELMAEPRLGYLFGFNLRLGIARGLDQGGFTQVYLRGGRSF
jgi:hypothetical protein